MGAPDALEPPLVKQGRLADHAYAELHRRIVRLELAPGQTLREDNLQDELGLGRTPVREALKRLELEHLVTIRPRSATTVSAVTAADVELVAEVREVLEVEAARLAASRIGAADRAGAAALAEHLSRAASPTPEQLMAWDERVHRLLWHAADNSYLEATLAGYFSLAIRTGYLVLGNAPGLSASILDEQALLAAVLDGDSERAGVLMRQHVVAFRGQALAALSD